MTNNHPTSLDFTEEDDLFVEIPVKIPNDTENYTLHTISGADATKYQNEQSRSIRFDANGTARGLNNLASLEPMLISMCLRDSMGKRVSEKKIGSWSFPIQRKLFKTAQQISRLNEELRLGNLLIEAFEDDECPCSLREMRAWTKGLDPKKFRPIQLLFSETDDELVKNSLNDTTDGSD